MNKETIDNKVYEVGFHLVPSIEEKDVSEEVVKIKSEVGNIEGSFISEGEPVLINLAYPIVKHLESGNEAFNKAYFGWVKFEAPAENIQKLNDSLKANPSVLRFLLINTVKENTMYSKPDKNRSASNHKEISSEIEFKGEPVIEEEIKEKKPASTEDIDKSIDELVIA